VDRACFPALRDHLLHLALQASGGALTRESIGFVLIGYDRSLRLSGAGPLASIETCAHRGDAPVYPASLAKLFCLYAFAAFEALGRFSPDEEDRRAARAMMEVSSNEAMAFLIGRLTGAFDGPCLDEDALEAWLARRHELQDWLMALARPEFMPVHVLHATYSDSPYGCAAQARRRSSGNLLTPMACARLMEDIVRGSAPSSAWMLELLDRSQQRRLLMATGRPVEGDQVMGFLGEKLPSTTGLWSKSGHTSRNRHDLVYAETAEGPSFILCVMTEGLWPSLDTALMPQMGRLVHRFFSDRTEPLTP
jgi:beta-lactamase class A